LPAIYHFSNGIKGKKINLQSTPSSHAADESRDYEKRFKTASEGFPSVSEIAQIAAILTNRNPINYTHPSTVANQAIELWEACGSMRKAKIREIVLMRIETEKNMQDFKELKPIHVPMPKKYPVDFDEFLRLTVGGRHKAHRLKIYRDYSRDMIWLGHVRGHQYKNNTAVMTGSEAEKLAEPATLDEVDDWIKHDKKTSIETEGIYTMRARAFLEWRAKQPAERARKAANKRWNKENPK
jgi:hypothetical protein